MKDPALYILTTEDPLWSDRLVASVVQAFPGQVRGVGLTGGLITRKRLVMSPFLYGFVRYGILGVKVVWGALFGGRIARLARREGIPVDDLPSVKDGRLREILADRGIDLMVSINCSQKLREPEFAAPRLGTINIHNSALPEYRGLMPILHAIREGRTANGVTVHVINGDLDDGPILAQESVPIGSGDDLFSVWKRCVDLGCTLLPRVVGDVLRGAVQPVPNDRSRASYYSFPSWAQIRAYHKAVRALRRR